MDGMKSSSGFFEIQRPKLVLSVPGHNGTHGTAVVTAHALPARRTPLFTRRAACRLLVRSKWKIPGEQSEKQGRLRH